MDDTRKHQLRAQASDHISRTFEGDASRITQALGILEFGFLFGYDATRICHSMGKCRDAEKLLGFKLIDVLPRRTEWSVRVRGIRMVDAGTALWNVIRGRVMGKAEVGASDQRELAL